MDQDISQLVLIFQALNDLLNLRILRILLSKLFKETNGNKNRKPQSEQHERIATN